MQIDLDMSLHFWVGDRECTGRTSIYHGPLLLVQETLQKPLSFSPQWQHFGTMEAVNQTGTSVEAVFSGTTIQWKGHRFDDGGQAKVTIDGKEVAIVDQYGPGRELPFSWEQDGLAPGEHTIKLSLIEERNPASKDRWINVISLSPPPADRPVLDATRMNSRPEPTTGTNRPQVMMDFTAVDGTQVRLRDFGTAGEGGISYISWLKVKNIAPTPFSHTNPLRSGRPSGIIVPGP